MSAWIDFKELRKRLNFEAVLRHYGVEIKRKGNQHHGYCPVPTHNGVRRSPSFSANLEKGVFQCFGCGAKGNVLEFAALMEGVDPANGTEFRKVALKLQEQFCPTADQKEDPTVSTKPPAEAPTTLPIVTNAPLDFELKGLDQEHPYLSGRGFSPGTIAHFGLGFCSRGLLKDRLAIPLHDDEGKLVGYAGRVIDDGKINEGNPRYKFPSKRERNGTLYEFRKTLFLYNSFRIKELVDELIVVEGFCSAWWLHQHGLPHVVATMGADCSESQAKRIVSLVKPAGRVWLTPDGDAAGQRFVESLLAQLAPDRFVRWRKLEPGNQPTDLSADQLKECFTV